ncbi:DUF4388 domain-containing protein [Egibacter rhizosphaerae]|uniref:DUF4388 domain-containing protein n=1 Tax=Egibacter rhizosphaerae TaxID=1670831 RepID=A0A411YGE6_9ACTN|nr:DUF4388 domain-containing protein [Egibacter rhizosphaerae]QBI20249.1 DUF4388 domain-containing protein [Egibacter rhizosphaerae]
MDARAGDLAGRGADQLLRDLAARRATGRLTLGSDAHTARVWMRDGAVLTASAPEARARLGDRLTGAGLLTQHQLDDALAMQRGLRERRRLGELLVEQGHIDRRTLREYVVDQITDSVSALLAWREGWWAFDPGVETHEDMALDTSVENLLMEATRRCEEWQVIRDALGSLDSVVDFVPRESGAELALTPDEWSLLTRIDGSATVAEIAEEAGYGQVETARIVYGLVTAGVVQVVDRGDADTQAGAPGERAAGGAGGGDAAAAGDAAGGDAAAGETGVGEAGSQGGRPEGAPDRERLLAEFAGLDDPPARGAPPPSGTRNPTGDPARQARRSPPRRDERSEGDDRRGGLFGRRRRR